MRRTIYLPDTLARQVEDYLDRHRDETLSSLVQRALQREVGPKDLGPLLELAGFVSVDIDPEERRPREDQVVDDER